MIQITIKHNKKKKNKTKSRYKKKYKIEIIQLCIEGGLLIFKIMECLKSIHLF
jgi:hypothetical protein